DLRRSLRQEGVGRRADHPEALVGREDFQGPRGGRCEVSRTRAETLAFETAVACEALRLCGPANLRAFVASIGLRVGSDLWTRVVRAHGADLAVVAQLRGYERVGGGFQPATRLPLDCRVFAETPLAFARAARVTALRIKDLTSLRGRPSDRPPTAAPHF